MAQDAPLIPTRESILAQLSRFFDDAVDQKEPLFEVNKNYVLKPVFAADGTLGAIEVRAKYRFSDTHPEWVEPHHPMYLGSAEYRSLRTKIESIKPIGKLEQTDPVIPVSIHFEPWRYLRYKRAFVTMAMVAGAHDPPGVDIPKIAFFSVYYLRPVTGFVRIPDAGGNRVCIDEESYFASPNDLRRVKPDKRQTITVAGPALEKSSGCESLEQSPAAKK